VGGFAVIQAGFHRFTGDIKFLIDPSLENEGRVFEALRVLPDKAVRELSSGDVSKYIVVRVADEVVVDLMANACGVNYADAIQDAKFSEIDGVKIPFASPKTLLRMKQTVRDKDIADLRFSNKSSTAPLRKRRKPPSSARSSTKLKNAPVEPVND
jgi:hypothetical protein